MAPMNDEWIKSVWWLTVLNTVNDRKCPDCLSNHQFLTKDLASRRYLILQNSKMYDMNGSV
jgi:hypothetical protein